MSKMRKLLAILLTFAMVLGMSITTFAEEETYDDAIRVYGVEEESGVTVTAYQIISYNENGYYEAVLPGSIATAANGDLAPTAANVSALALRTDELTESDTLTKNGDYYTGTLTAGTWMIIVSGSAKYLYNPAIISVEQGPNGLVYGKLNLDTDSWADQLYVKKSEPTVTKRAVEETPNDNVSGVQYADEIKYTIEIDVPSYTPEVAEDATLTITDTLVDAKLVKVNDIDVKVGGVDDEAMKTLVKAALVENATSFTFTIDDEKWLIDNAGKKIVITYSAQVTAAAKKVDELTNTVKYVYTTNHNPIIKEDSTIHYTFSIDGEFVKIAEKVEGEETKLLNGAEFQLHIGSEDGELYEDANGKRTFTTVDGKLVIRGLDSDTVYYLVETKAPTGYTINETPVEVRFEASFEENGKYISHVIKFNGNAANEETPYEFVNTKLVSLPSTGGIGTTMFTIGGCGIMIAAAYLFFASRRKEEA